MPASTQPPTDNLDKFVKVCKSIGPIEAVLGVPLTDEDQAADSQLHSYVTAFYSALHMVTQRVQQAYGTKSKGLMDRFNQKQQEALKDPAKMAELQREAEEV